MRFRAVMTAGALAATVSLAPVCAQAAALVNGSFEDILGGWVADPFKLSISPEISVQDADGNILLDADGVPIKRYTPVDGIMFAVMVADQPGPPFDAGPPVAPKRVSQPFTTDGGWFSGWAAFFSSETPDYNDYAVVHVFNDDVDFTLFQSDVVSIQELGYTPWTRFSRYLDAGDYTVEAMIGSGTDNLNPSFLILDKFSAGVPEPTTWAMMFLGFFGLGAMLRRRQSALACTKA